MRSRRAAASLALVALAGLLLYWGLTRAAPLAAASVAGIEPDAERGARVFHAAGCASCHVAPDAEDEGPPVLEGGQRFPSPFGTFVAPNISPDPEHGIGGWSTAELVTAIRRGVSPEGEHYYPALPYPAYRRAELDDLVHLDAYLRTLPASNRPDEAHDVPFPFSVRRNLGLWKLLFLNDDWVMPAEPGSELARGRYLVEALGHCAECHTPRNRLGGLDRSRWMAGAPNPTGEGRIPNITPAGLDWSKRDLVEFFTSGFTPDFDTAGGEMAKVVRELARLPEADREAIAAYVKALPPAE